MKTKEQFVTETLIGYVQDPTTCSISENGRCQYQTKDGRKCAFGKYLKEYEEEYEDQSADNLLFQYSASKLLTPEAAEQNLSSKEWMTIQFFHDRVAKHGSNLNIIWVKEAFDNLKSVFECEFKELEVALKKNSNS